MVFKGSNVSFCFTCQRLDAALQQNFLLGAFLCLGGGWVFGL
jgi:hypothetical protein